MNKHDIDEYNLCEKMRDKINKLFLELNKEYDLKSGDITPKQKLQLEEFEILLTDYIIQNYITDKYGKEIEEVEK